MCEPSCDIVPRLGLLHRSVSGQRSIAIQALLQIDSDPLQPPIGGSNGGSLMGRYSFLRVVDLDRGDYPSAAAQLSRPRG